MPRLLNIPDTMVRWPWARCINPHYAEVSVESQTWFNSFSAFFPEKLATFDRCKSCLLASLAWPDADKDLLRSACDLIHLFYVFEEQTDESHAMRSQTLANIVLDAMSRPEHPRPDGEPIVGEVARQFWLRARTGATASGMERFLDEWGRYVFAVVEQSKDRDEARLRTVEEYLALRRYTVGVEACYPLAVLKENLPLEVSAMPIFEDVRKCITEIAILDNDLFSYRKEVAAGDDIHNIIPLVMHEKHLDLDEAIAWLAEEHAHRVDHFLTVLWPKVSSLAFGSADVDKAVAVYLAHLTNWPRANECWSFENHRYFGEEGERIKVERVVALEDSVHAIQPPKAEEPVSSRLLSSL